MCQHFYLHPDNPQQRLIREAVKLLKSGGVMVYPTDSCYAIGCMIGNKEGMERIRALRGVDEKHMFTLICRDLSEIARFALVDNKQYRMLKSATPGGYTFILEATKEVPRRLQHPKRSTIGLRVPEHPILSMTLQLPGDDYPLNDPEEIVERIGNRIDVMLDSGFCGIESTTVVDLTGAAPELIRAGTGDVRLLGFE